MIDVEAAAARSGRAPLIALALCVIALFACYTRFARTFPRNSDDAAFVLEARDILRGNVLLHGWNLPPDTFYASITPWYVVGALVIRNAADLMYLVPSLIYAILVGFLLAIVWSRSDAAHRVGSVLATLAIVALPAYARIGPPTGSGAEHTATVLFVLASFYLLAAGSRPELGAIPLALAMIGDPLAIFIGAVPLAVVGASRFYFDRSDRRCLTAAAAAALISFAGSSAIPKLGGFSAWGLSEQFATPTVFFHKLALCGQYSLSLFGLEISSGIESLLAAPARVAMLFLAVCAVCGAAMDLVKRDGDVLAQLSVVAVVMDIAAYVTSTQPVDWTTIRFLTPVVIFGGLLAGLWWYRIGISARYVLAVILLAVIINGAAFVQAMFRPAVELPESAISYLVQAGLHEGYGGYWDANLLSVASGGNLRVRAVGMGNAGKLVFLPWYANDQWARMRDARFLIFSSEWGGVSEIAATNTWGPPAKVKTLGNYHVLIWNKPLSVANPFSQL